MSVWHSTHTISKVQESFHPGNHTNSSLSGNLALSGNKNWQLSSPCLDLLETISQVWDHFSNMVAETCSMRHANFSLLYVFKALSSVYQVRILKISISRPHNLSEKFCVFPWPHLVLLMVGWQSIYFVRITHINMFLIFKSALKDTYDVAQIPFVSGSLWQIWFRDIVLGKCFFFFVRQWRPHNIFLFILATRKTSSALAKASLVST